MVGNAVLAALKVTAGFVSGSLAVVGDGIDSTTDIVTSLVTLLAARIMGKPPDATHPYGHTRVETMATKILSFVIFFVGAQLAISTVRRLLAHDAAGLPTMLALYVTAFSIVGKIALAIHQFRIGRRYDSSMLIANGKNMRNDIVISAAVLVGLVFTHLLRLPILDTVSALAVSVWIMKSAFDIFLETSTELMDGMEDDSMYQQIFDAVAGVEGAHNPHRTRVRKLSNMHVIDLDIEVDESMSVHDAHEVAMRVESEIRRKIPSVYDVIVHVEPLGNIEHSERYGLAGPRTNGNEPET